MNELELRDYLRILWKRKWLIIAATIVCIGLAAALTARTTPEYQAEAKLFIGQRQVATAEIQTGVQVAQLSQQLLVTYAEVIRTTPIIERAVQRKNIPIDARKLAGQLRADPIVDTQLLRISFRHPDPLVAQRTVNAVADEFVDQIERIEGTATQAADEPAINVSVVQPALRAGAPVTPRPVRNMALAVVLGLMIGFGLVLLVEYLDTTIKDKDDIEDRLDLPVLASIPKIQMRRDELYLEGDNQSAFAETFRKLRTAIQLYGAASKHRTILVTSPRASEGKSTTAINLAAVYAYSGSKTVLVEADLRRPNLHAHFTIKETNGFTMALLGRIPIDDAIIWDTYVPNLACLPAGAIPQNPVELLASDRMRQLLDELHERFETIIIDAPPLLPVADASTIAPRVDGVVLVARVKQTRRDQLRESVELLRKVGGNVLGVTLNAMAETSRGESYYYYSSYRPVEDKPRRRRLRASERP